MHNDNYKCTIKQAVTDIREVGNLKSVSSLKLLYTVPLIAIAELCVVGLSCYHQCRHGAHDFFVIGVVRSDPARIFSPIGVMYVYVER